MQILVSLRGQKIDSKKDYLKNFTNDKMELVITYYGYEKGIIKDYEEKKMLIESYSLFRDKTDKDSKTSNLEFKFLKGYSIENSINDLKENYLRINEEIANSLNNHLIMNDIDENVYLFILGEDNLSSSLLKKLVDKKLAVNSIDLLEYFNKKEFKDLMQDFITNNSLTYPDESNPLLDSFTISRLLNY